MRKIHVLRGSPTHRGIIAGAGVALAAFALYIPFYFNPFRVDQLTRVLVYAVALLGLNLLTGYSGQITLGHSAFFAVGAYAAAILIDTYEWHYLAVLPFVAVFSFVVGFAFGIPALRLHGLYLALATLGLAVAAPPLLKRFEDLTGGVQGINIARPDPPGWIPLAEDQWLYFLILAITVVLFVLGRNLLRGRVGRALIAIRDNEIVAETMGVNLATYKTLAFAYSSMYAGLGGVLYTYAVAFVAPDSFTVVLAILFLAASVVGGLASVSGAVFGAFFFVYVPPLASQVNRALANVIFGAALILFMYVMPGGFVGLLRRVRDVFVTIETPREPPSPVETEARRTERQPALTEADPEGGA